MSREEKIELLRQALRDIIDPIAKMKRELPDGTELTPMMMRIAGHPYYLKDIAHHALKQEMDEDDKRLHLLFP
jgi:hypothetical protein